MKTFIILKKELRAYFGLPIAYTVVTIFLLISGYFFHSDVIFFSLFLTGMKGNATFGVMRNLFDQMSVIMLLVLPLLTMRLFSEEKKIGTFELLLTYPIRDIEILMGKFLSAIFVFFIMLSITFAYPILLSIYSKVDFGPILSGYIGLFLMGVAFISFGVFASSLTENQIVAAVTSFGILLLFWAIAWNEGLFPPIIGKILVDLSMLEHFYNFSKGVIDTHDIIYYLNFTTFFLFLTLRSLESKRWRG
jgi:ABC-2 type transport system permease protein